MNPKNTRFARKTPDHVSGEIARALIARKPAIGFNELFDIVFAALRQRNLASSGEEMMRLRSYEKLQNMVTQGLVNKIGKEYRATKRLANKDFDGTNPQPEDTKVRSQQPIAKSFIDEEGKEYQTAYINGYWFGDRLLEGVIFTCTLDSEGYLSVGVHESGKKYFESLNAKKWLEEALAFAEKHDIFCESPTLSGTELEFHELFTKPKPKTKPKAIRGHTLQEVVTHVMEKSEAAPKKKLAPNLVDLAFQAVREKGVKYLAEAESSDGRPVIVDTDTGDCYEVIVAVRKIK